MVNTTTVKNTAITISIVCYQSPMSLLKQVIDQLTQAVKYANQHGAITQARLLLVNNGVDKQYTKQLNKLAHSIQLPCMNDNAVISGHGNIGYGCGHNLAIRHNRFNYHLILNPDVLLAEDSLCKGLAFLNRHPDVALLAPAAVNDIGNKQYLCKRFPTVLDLALRGLAPAWLQKHFQRRLERYELRDLIQDDKQIVWDIPIISGCFMLFRTSVLAQLGGFSPRYFMYFEDFDLSLRVADIARIVYVPSVRIVHFGGNTVAKGWRHIILFTRSGITFFNQHGWKWL